MTFPGILLRTAILMPVGVSETLSSVAWLCLVQTKCWLAKPYITRLCLKGVQALLSPRTLDPPL